MAGDRGRDLKFSILSDTSKFDLAGPAKEMGDLGDASHDTARDVQDTTSELKRLAAQGKDAQRQLDALNKEVKDNQFDEYGKDAKDAAKKADDAFDTIAKSAKTNMRTVEKAADDGFKDTGHHTEEFRDEAKANLSEVASSFSGDMTSAVDLIQGTLGGLATMMGPAGGIAAAAAIGVGLVASYFSNSQAAAEAAKQATQDYFDALVEGQGKITESTVQSRLEDLVGNPDDFAELSKQAKAAGINVTTYARAVSGSIPDQKKVAEAIKATSDRLDGTVAANIDAKNAMADTRRSLKTVSDRLKLTEDSLNDANSAFNVARDSMQRGIVAPVDVDTPSSGELTTAQAQMQRVMGKTLTAPVNVHAPVSAAAEARASMMRYFTRNPLQIPAVVNPRDPHGKKIRDIP